MTPQRILQSNALSTAACAVAMLATRGFLHAWFGLATSLLLDALAVAFLGYAAALALVARQHAIARPTLLAFAIVDALWVVGSGVVLALFWDQLTPAARALVIAVALVVEVFAALQYRAAGSVKTRALGLA